MAKKPKKKAPEKFYFTRNVNDEYNQNEAHKSAEQAKLRLSNIGAFTGCTYALYEAKLIATTESPPMIWSDE